MQVTPNFTLNLAKLDDQYDTKNIPSLISVVSADSKTLGHRMGAFQGALQVLQSIVLEMQGQGGIGAIAGKQLSVILDQVHTRNLSGWEPTRLPSSPEMRFQPRRACVEKNQIFNHGGGQGDHSHPA